jgi:hypothetical protein
MLSERRQGAKLCHPNALCKPFQAAGFAGGITMKLDDTIVKSAQCTADPLGADISRGGQLHSGTATSEQARTEVKLDLSNRASDSGLCQVDRVGCCADATQPCHFIESMKMPDVKIHYRNAPSHLHRKRVEWLTGSRATCNLCSQSVWIYAVKFPTAKIALPIKKWMWV